MICDFTHYVNSYYNNIGFKITILCYQASQLRSQLSAEIRRRQAYVARSGRAARDVQRLRSALGDSLRTVSQVRQRMHSFHLNRAANGIVSYRLHAHTQWVFLCNTDILSRSVNHAAMKDCLKRGLRESVQTCARFYNRVDALDHIISVAHTIRRSILMIQYFIKNDNILFALHCFIKS